MTEFTTEFKKNKLMKVYASRVRILTEPHMRSLPIIGHCRIEMVGGEALLEVIGEFSFNLLARALHWLQGVESEMIRRTYFLDTLRHLSVFDMPALENHCFSILRLPSAPPALPRKKRYEPMQRLADRSPLTFVNRTSEL